jgi:hypothetical protein
MTKAATTDDENATEASYRVSYRIELTRETHTIAETLIKPCAVEMAECMLDEQAKKKLETTRLLSNNVVHRRIQDLSAGRTRVGVVTSIM